MFLIYSSHITNRLLYVLNYIFNEQFGIAYSITTHKEEFLNSSSVEKIVYANDNFCDCIFIKANSFLFENDVKQIDLNDAIINNTLFLFKNKTQCQLGFDVFAAVFFLLSRYEEYYDLPKDKFGNYNYKNSVLYKQSVLHIPVVEQWVEMFKAFLLNRLPKLKFKQYKATYFLSFDIDVAFAYQNRSLKRVIGGFFKKLVKLQLKEFLDQMLTVLHLKKDMYDTFAYILSNIKNKRSVFFFNMGKYGEFDKNPSHKNKNFRQRILNVYKNNVVGLHPSYASNLNKELLAKEKQWLEAIIHQPINISRQHYLKLNFPKTYQTLIQNDIEKDFTPGYHDAYGFRAGTCKSFLFFDLEKNKSTNLRLYPFAVMEGTLNDVLKLSVDEAKAIILNLIEITEKYNGIFIPLWHNSTLSDKEHWKGWRVVFEYMLSEIDNRNLVNFFEA